MGQSKPINTHTILIVEDEPLIRFNLVDFFHDKNYIVFEADDADQAIAILDGHNDIRIVLTDVQMPGSMDGIKLAHYIRKRFPPTILVITSGVLSPTRELLPEHSLFFSKPLDPHRVLRHIEKASQ